MLVPLGENAVTAGKGFAFDAASGEMRPHECVFLAFESVGRAGTAAGAELEGLGDFLGTAGTSHGTKQLLLAAIEAGKERVEREARARAEGGDLKLCSRVSHEIKPSTLVRVSARYACFGFSHGLPRPN